MAHSVLAHCFQLQDGLAVLELDRVLDSSPDDLNPHREGIRAGRVRRRNLISATTQRLLERLDAVASIANTQVLLHPVEAKAVVHSGNEVGTDLAHFNGTLGIEQDRSAREAKRWSEVVGEARDTVVHTAEVSAASTARISSEALANVKFLTTTASKSLTQRLPWKRSEQTEDSERD